MGESEFEFPFEIESAFRFHCARFRFEFECDPWKMLSERSPNPLGNAPGGTPEMLPGERPGTPGREPEKSTLSNWQKTTIPWGIARENARLRTFSP